MKIALLLGLSFAILSGCQPAAAPSPRIGAPAPSNSSYWQFFDGSLAMLPDESDNVQLSLSCDAPKGISVTGGPDANNPHVVSLRSGAASALYPAKVEEDEMMGVLAIAMLPRGDPVLAAFAATGNVTHNGYALNATTARERKAIKDFFASCP